MSDNKGNKQGEENLFHQETSEHKHTFRIVEDGNAVKNEREPDSIPVYYQPKPNKTKANNWLTPVVLTVLSAGIIGTVLGMLLLQLFVGMEDEQVQGEVTTPVNTPAAPPPVEATLQSLPKLSAYVIQAGVFSEQANAEEWRTVYDELGEPTFIWEREGQYFLFIGIFGTDDLAKQKVEVLQADGHDVFVKSWETVEKEIELSTDGSSWLDEFKGEWVKALNVKDRNGLLNLVEQAPSTNTLENLMKQLTITTDDTDVYLLELMYVYENL